MLLTPATILVQPILYVQTQQQLCFRLHVREARHVQMEVALQAAHKIPSKDALGATFFGMTLAETRATLYNTVQMDARETLA